MPYGNMIDGFTWDYAEWQTITYPEKDCFYWNNKEWIGTAPEYPQWTECGLATCVLCSQQVLSEQVYVYVSTTLYTDMAI